MSNIFEQPWTLLIAAAFCLAVVFTIRQAFFEKSRLWHFAIPVIIAIAAFGLDILVKTDLEKINLVIKKGMNAVENERFHDIATILSPDYKDSYHSSKKMFMNNCLGFLTGIQFEKISKSYSKVEISGPTATANIRAKIIFDKKTPPTRVPAWQIHVTVKLNFRKVSRKTWMIERAEVTHINNYKVRWREFSYRQF